MSSRGATPSKKFLLAERRRQALILHRNGASCRTIAAALGTSPATASRDVRSAMADQLGEYTLAGIPERRADYDAQYRLLLRTLRQERNTLSNRELRALDLELRTLDRLRQLNRADLDELRDAGIAARMESARLANRIATLGLAEREGMLVPGESVLELRNRLFEGVRDALGPAFQHTLELWGVPATERGDAENAMMGVLLAAFGEMAQDLRNTPALPAGTNG